MGRVLVIARLASRDLRRRPGEAALLLLAIAAATSTLTLGLVLRGVISKPYQATREATAGPDVVAGGIGGGGAGADRSAVKALTGASGVVAHSGPYPVVPVVLAANGHTVVAQTEGRDAAPAAVDQPKPTKGGWVRGGGVVLEAAFAQALGVSPGDRVTMKPLDVTGGPGAAPSLRARGRVVRSRSRALRSPPPRPLIPRRRASRTCARATPTPGWRG